MIGVVCHYLGRGERNHFARHLLILLNSVLSGLKFGASTYTNRNAVFLLIYVDMGRNNNSMHSTLYLHRAMLIRGCVCPNFFRHVIGVVCHYLGRAERNHFDMNLLILLNSVFFGLNSGLQPILIEMLCFF